MIEIRLMSGRAKVVFHSGDILIVIVNAYNRSKRSVFMNETIGTYYFLGRPSHLLVTYLLPEKKNVFGRWATVGILLASGLVGGIVVLGCVLLSVAIHLPQASDQTHPTPSEISDLDAVNAAPFTNFVVDTTIEVH